MRWKLKVFWHFTSAISEFHQASLAKYQSQKRGLMQDLLTGKVRVTPLLQTGGDRHL
ncbi:hypothetical protein [Planktothrix sp. FACHB-1365]|uniref:hypothetical protein n=1 Tax=Planktothrix sp. FACHB-1365 TaxID=2692855 RepID=UPI001688E8F4|nr:hypothetical protein [Planktothrix sp. FACHB-1365]MBD2483960.1 hypothetical protein [Planktothrix sp. FACHB-1365]